VAERRAPNAVARREPDRAVLLRPKQGADQSVGDSALIRSLVENDMGQKLLINV
jgi:hypothetical protein